MASNTTNDEIKGYMKMRDVCKYLSVTAETISKWIRNDGMPGHKIGKQWMFSKQEIDAWVVGHNANGRRVNVKKSKGN